MLLLSLKHILLYIGDIMNYFSTLSILNLDKDEKDIRERELIKGK
jgi:hypothetical protein